MAKKEKKPIGHPVKNVIEPIPDTFENILKAVVKPVKKTKKG